MRILDRLLTNYDDSNFVLRQKARVLAVACLTLLATSAFVFIYSYHLQKRTGSINPYMLLVELAGIFFFAGALKLLVKGFYEIAAHLVIIISLALAWAVLFVDRYPALPRMNTIVFIMGIMTMTALIIYRQKFTVFFYFALNEALLIIFVLFSKNSLGLSTFETIDFLVDNSIVLTFISVIAYNVIAVNKRALERVEKDIERKKKAEATLQEKNTALVTANNRFAAVMDSLDAFVYVADMQTYEVLYINQAIQERFGDVTGGICWQAFYPENDGPCPFCNNHLLTDEKGKPSGVHTREFCYPGDNQWYESREQAITWIDGRLVRMEIVTNITEQRKAREIMVETEKMATVGGMAAGMAHEINNPLGIILQSTQNIQRRLSGDFPRNQEAARETGVDLGAVDAYLQERKILKYLDGINEAGTRASKIVADMLQFSRKHNADEKKPVGLDRLIDSALEMVSQDYNLKKHYDFRHIKITKDFDPALPEIRCHANEIEQVLLNLLINAAWALSDVRREGFLPKIDLRTWLDGRRAILEIADNGPGIEPETLKHIFEPFFTTKGPKTGTGLGLSVSYFIIKNNHHGKIAAVSEPGRGTTFTIRLPL